MAVLKLWPEVKITRLIDIFTAVFSNQFFQLKRTAQTHREFGRLPQILTVGRLTHKQQKGVWEFFSFLPLGPGAKKDGCFRRVIFFQYERFLYENAMFFKSFFENVL